MRRVSNTSPQATWRLQGLVDRLYPTECLAAACIDRGAQCECLIGTSRTDHHFVVRFWVDRSIGRNELIERCRSAIDGMLNQRKAYVSPSVDRS